ncbi:hypothetical protein D3C87_1774760 [compost metagenome]
MLRVDDLFTKTKKQEHLHENSQPAALPVAGFQPRLRGQRNGIAEPLNAIARLPDRYRQS